MIQIDRSRVPEPRRLKRLRAAGLRHARAFFIGLPAAERRQSRYFNPYWQKAYRVPIPALARLFRGKCAFCESLVDLKQHGILDHFRPKWATRGLGRDYAPDHYWWLSFAWTNLYLTCPECNKHRGPRFPVRGPRIAGPHEEPSAEQPLLLDPCADLPSEHLRFDISGRVQPLSRRGEITIKLLALNRSVLVKRRRELGTELKAAWREVERRLPRVSDTAVDKLNRHVGPRAEFSAFATQVIQGFLAAAKVDDVKGLKVAHASEKVRRSQVITSKRQELTPRFIDEIRLTNFKGIASLTLKTPSSDQSNMDWLMLIGENAAGKSSLLQAVTINLMSDQERARLRLSPRDYIRRGTTSAEVSVRFRGQEELRVLRITRSGFRCNDSKAGAPLMAYGATRLPPRRGVARRELAVENLFNPFAPMRDAVSWLVGLAKHRRADFDYAARALKSMLPDKRPYLFRAVRGQVIVEPEGPLPQLSDGFQSVIALAADIMATVHQSFRGSMEATEGIVLIDELGAHLHPRWKMRLTKVLRAAFPRMQFIVTTHDPLCLRGLRNGEIVTLEKTRRGRVFTRTDLPPVEGMRVDQILQSEFFGLRSAMDPDVEEKFERMYRLKAKAPSTLTARQRRDLQELERALAPVEVLGNTRAERLMLSTIDRYLAVEREQPSAPARERAWAAAQKQIASRLQRELGVSL